jgi:hypothetical protein
VHLIDVSAGDGPRKSEVNYDTAAEQAAAA